MEAPAIAKEAVALLGRKDIPTDGVEDYCRSLSAAMGPMDCHLELIRVSWDQTGWLRACFGLWRECSRWKEKPVLLQYTALMWSRRGFPLRLLLILGLLMIRGVRLIVVFHDSNAYPGTRPVDRLRRACQVFIMRSAYRLSVASILGVPLESASWLAAKPLKASFIPIGANVPYVAGPMGIRREPEQSQEGHPTAKTIAVFGVTDGGNTSREVADIVFVAKAAAERLGRVRLVTLGRGSCESEHQFRQALNGCGVEYRALGILPPEEVASVLSGSDVSLFVRGHISTQRSTAIASIACALPLVGYADACLPGPLAEAGVVGVPCGDRDALAEAAVRVMSDPQLDADLRQLSQNAYQRHFCWEAVAGRFAHLLNHA